MAKDARLNMKVDGAELAVWKTAASEAGLTLSEWIRKKCEPPAESLTSLTLRTLRERQKT
jgi:hypothetical protein